MSQTFLNNFEYALANGTALTTGNSSDGSGNQAFNTVTNNSANGGSLDIYTSDAARGTSCLQIVTGTSSNPVIAWGSSTITGGVTTAWVRAYVKMSAYPPSTLRLFKLLGTSAVNLGDIDVNSSGQLKIDDASNTVQKTFTNSLTLNSWNRIEAKYVSNATTGSIQAWFYPGDSVSATETETATGINTNGANVAGFNFGALIAITAGYTFLIDEIGYSDAGALGPSTTPNPTVGGWVQGCIQW